MNLLRCAMKKAGVGYIGEIMILFFLFSGFAAATGASSCPLEVSPSRAVVRYNDSFSANCSSSSSQVDGMGWESSLEGIQLTPKVSFLSLTVKSITVWDFEPSCFINLIDGTQCQEVSTVTVYKEPDMIYLSEENLAAPLVEGKKYDLRCNVANVAPVRNLAVSWHKRSGVFHTEMFQDTSKRPLNKSSVVSLTVDRDDDGTFIWCEAKLNFEPIGPSLPSVESPRVKVAVLYPPTLPNPADEELKLSADGDATLNCTAAGNPVPEYSWEFPHEIQQTSEKKNRNQPILTIELAGTYTCTSSNPQGRVTKVFKVIQERRSPALIVGLIVGALALALLIGVLWYVYGKSDGKCSFSKGGDSSGPL